MYLLKRSAAAPVLLFLASMQLSGCGTPLADCFLNAVSNGGWDDLCRTFPSKSPPSRSQCDELNRIGVICQGNPQPRGENPIPEPPFYASLEQELKYQADDQGTIDSPRRRLSDAEKECIVDFAKKCCRLYNYPICDEY